MKQAKRKITGNKIELPFDLNEFFGQRNLTVASELYERLQQPLIKSGETGISARNLHYWDSTLGINERKGNEKHKFTFTEFVWLKTVEQLREAGLNLSVIAVLKEQLFTAIPVKEFVEFISKEDQINQIIEKLESEHDKQMVKKLFSAQGIKEISEHENFYLFDMIIADCIINREPIRLAVFLNGDFIPVCPNQTEKFEREDLERLYFNTHVSVSISGIIREFLLSDVSEFLIPKIGIDNLKTNKLLEYVNSGNYESITVNFKDKKIKSLELKKSENVEKKLNELMKKSEFGEVIIKRHKGKTIRIDNITKITL